MADSDRSRSPVPGRNRYEPRGPAQPVRQELPFVPRWCGPMQAAVWHSQQMSRPQFRPQFTMQQSGAYMPNRSMHQNPPVLRAHGPVNGSHHTTLSTNTTSITKHSIRPIISTSSIRHSHKRPHQEAKQHWMPPVPVDLISTLTGKRTKTTMTTRRSTA